MRQHPDHINVYCTHGTLSGWCVIPGCKHGRPRPPKPPKNCPDCLDSGTVPRNPKSLALGLMKPCPKCAGGGA